MYTRFITLCIVLGIFVPFLTVHAQEDAPTIIQDQFFRAKVVEIHDEQQVDELGQTYMIQEVTVQIRSHEEKGKDVDLTYEVNQGLKGRILKEGDNVVLGKTNPERGTEVSYYISDVYRLNTVYVVLALFAVLVVGFIGWSGVRSFLGLGISFAVILLYVIPHILAGGNPFMIGIIASLLIASTALFIAHGVNIRTTVAFASTFITIVVALFLSEVVVGAARLTGLGSEDAYNLQFANINPIDLTGLLLAGIIIGTLGVLDDITTAQAAAVDEIQKANPKLGFGELYKRGISVGKEHIISLVNTLILAYTGASLPLLLLFSIYTRPVWVTLNSEIVLEEVVRMLIGSSALIIAVPLTTLIAAYLFSEKGQALRVRMGDNIFFRESSHHGHYH